MHFSHCTYANHGAQILAILNEAIVNSTALYDYQPRTLDSMASWFRAKAAGSYPVIGAFDNNGEVLGFASYGAFRNWPAYKYTVEHSVYIHKDQRGKGIGRMLMERLVAEAKQQQYHLMVGAIDAENQASIALHEKLGFHYSGTIKQAGFKFGRWLDVAFYQLIMDTPTAPVDG